MAGWRLLGSEGLGIIWGMRWRSWQNWKEQAESGETERQGRGVKKAWWGEGKRLGYPSCPWEMPQRPKDDA